MKNWATSYLRSVLDILMKQRIALGFFFAGIFLGIAEPTTVSLGAGAVVMITGEAIRTWASGYIHKGKKVACYGPYAHIRHPLYTGSFVMGLGLCVMGGSPFFLVLYVVLFSTVYLRIIRSEEAHMEESFGHDYVVFKENVPLLIPRITAWSGQGAGQGHRQSGEGTRFRWGSVRRNKEYEAWIGLACVTAVLFLKYLILT